MAVDIVSLALDFIENYGLIAIFILLVLDGALLLPVFPGELVLIMAVATYATDPGGLVFLIALSTAAGLLGSLILYFITRGGGRRLVERFPKFFMMPRKRRERLERTFQRPIGQSLVLFLRLFPLTRVLVSIPAGLARMPFLRFVVLSTIGLLGYNAGFLWFAYETRRPGSAVGAQATQLQEAYANPAWDFVEANVIITGVVLLGFGSVLSVRASRRAMLDPEESPGTLVGALSTAVLFWGGLALAAATYLDPQSVYTLAELGGVDVEALADRVGYAPVPLLWAASALFMLIGYVVARYRRSAQERRKTRLAVERAMAERRTHEKVVFKPSSPEPERLEPWPERTPVAQSEADVEARDRDGHEVTWDFPKAEGGEAAEPKRSDHKDRPAKRSDPEWDDEAWEWREP